MSSNAIKLLNNNIFVKISDKSVGSKEMHEVLESKLGKIMSAKVSMNEDYTFRGYGFTTFDSPESAQKAVKE